MANTYIIGSATAPQDCAAIAGSGQYWVSDVSTGPVTAVTLNAGGTGYEVDDVLTIVQSGSGGNATVTVATVADGVVTAVTLTARGTGYAAATGLSTTGGNGTGCKVNITAISPSISVATTDSASDAAGIKKCFKSTRAAGNASGSLYARAYRANSPALPGTDDVIDVFFKLKVGTDWQVLSDAGAEVLNWYPDVFRLACTTTSLVLKLYKYYNAETDLSHQFRFRVSNTSSSPSYVDQKTLGYNPEVTPGAWHEIHWRTVGWNTWNSVGVQSYLWVDGHPVTWDNSVEDDGYASDFILPTPGPVSAVEIAGGGSGYEVDDVLTIVQEGSGGNATVTVTEIDPEIGPVAGLIVNAGGDGYAVDDTLTVTQVGSGGDCTATVDSITTTQGPVATVEIGAGGTGYQVDDVLTLTQVGSGGDCTVTVTTVDSGVVTGVSLTAAGTGYVVADGLATTGGSGSNCTIDVLTLTQTGAGTGVVTAITLTAAGTDYTLDTGLATTTDGDGEGCTVDMTGLTQDGAGIVTAVTISAAGTGYTIAENLATTGGNGNTDCTISVTGLTAGRPSAVYAGHNYNSGATTLSVAANLYFDDVTVVSSPDADEAVDARVGEMHSKVLPQSDGSIKVMTQTLTPCTGTLRYGTATGALTTAVESSAVTEHDDYVLWFDLGELTANTTYYYQVTLTDTETNAIWRSLERTFKTDPGDAAHTALILVGCQDSTYRGYTGGWAASNHSTVGLTIYNGDIGDHYTNLETWASDYELQRIGWGRNETLTKPLDSRSLCVLQPSNHDFMLDNGAAFWTMHPGAEFWHLPYGYADYYFLSMGHSPETASQHTRQIAWLKNVLPQGQRRFKIVVFEYCMFGNHDATTGRRSMIDRADLHDIFTANKVNLVVAGDVPVYNRWASGGVMYCIAPPVTAINTTPYLNVKDFKQTDVNPTSPTGGDVPTDPALEPKYGSRRALSGQGRVSRPGCGG